MAALDGDHFRHDVRELRTHNSGVMPLRSVTVLTEDSNVTEDIPPECQAGHGPKQKVPRSSVKRGWSWQCRECKRARHRVASMTSAQVERKRERHQRWLAKLTLEQRERRRELDREYRPRRYEGLTYLERRYLDIDNNIRRRKRANAKDLELIRELEDRLASLSARSLVPPLNPSPRA